MQLILNFHNACRTKDENMIQIAVCPGKPKDLHSFLKPIFDEVEQMYKNKLVIKKQGTEVFRGRVAILGVTGDIPGITELMGSVGHTGTYGCRVSKAAGHGPLGISRMGKYFPVMGELRSTEELVVGDPVSQYNSLMYEQIT